MRRLDIYGSGFSRAYVLELWTTDKDCLETYI